MPESLIPEGYMRVLARDTLIKELSFALRKGKFWEPDPDAEKRATEIVDKAEEQGKLYDLLESTMPEPCPECGRV